MYIINKYKIPINQKSFIVSMPQYSCILGLEKNFSDNDKDSPVFNISAISNASFPIIEYRFYLFGEGEPFDITQEDLFNYILPISYIGTMLIQGKTYYLFVINQKDS